MKDLTVGKEWKLILQFALPMIIGNIFMQLYNNVDSIIVGRYIGTEALAAVGASMPVVFAVISMIIGLSSGASVIVSQYFGAKEYDKVHITSDTLQVFLIGVGILVGIGGYFFSDDIFILLGLPEEVMPQAVTYLQIFLGGIVFMFGFNSLAAILRGVGDSMTPLYFLTGACLLNIVLDLVFVISFDWGVAGAGWATIISQAGAYFSTIIYVNRKYDILKIQLLKLRFDRRIFRQCVNYGLPTGFQQTFVSLGMLALLGVVSSFGTNTIAAYTAAGRIDSFAMMPAMNFGMALQSFVGQNIGAGRYDRVHRGLIETLKMTSIVCIITSALIIAFGADLIGLFTTNTEVIAIGREYLVVVCSFFLLFSTMFAMNGLFRGAGAVIVPMFVTLLSLWLVRVPLAVWLSKYFGAYGIWWAIPFGWLIGAAGTTIYYYTGKWKNHSIFDKNKNKPIIEL